MDMSSQNRIFDRALVRRHRDRAAAEFAQHSIVFEEAAIQLMERLRDVKRDFPLVLDLGAHNGLLTRQLPGVVVASDLSEGMMRACISSRREQEGQDPSGCNGPLSGSARLITGAFLPSRHESLRVVADEEFLPFAAESFDLIMSNLSLHWVNDLPGAFAQIKRTLKVDGLFLAAVLGGQTLHELRSCLLDAELKITGGVSPRLSPAIDLPTASALLQRAGFALPVTDQESVMLTYPDLFSLLHDLRGMGETNAHLDRLRRPIRHSIFAETERLYRERFADREGRLLATFEILFLHGWRG